MFSSVCYIWLAAIGVLIEVKPSVLYPGQGMACILYVFGFVVGFNSSNAFQDCSGNAPAWAVMKLL